MKRILFFHQGRFADFAGSIYKGLRQQFPQTEILRFDVHDLIRSRLGVLAGNLLAMLPPYGLDLLRRRRDLDDAFFTTGYIFRQLKRISLAIHREYPANCSFQMLSMHDHSCPGVPHFVYTDHSYETRKQYPAYGKYIWASTRPDWLIRIERTIYDGATCIFTQNRNVAETLVDTYRVPPGKVMWVRYGPNLDQAQLSALPTDLDRYASKTVLVVGTRWARKGGPQLLKAFERVHQVHPDAKLVIVGSTPPCSHDYVQIVGKLPLDELLTWYARSSVFCMPSLLEPSASGYVEALSAGMPIIALRLGSVCDLVNDGQVGHLVEPDDVEGLARVLIGLLDDPNRCQQMGRAGRDLVTREYTWDRTFTLIAQRMTAEVQNP
jgi:glycosyltransferase involved in cell wall biosynthesis